MSKKRALSKLEGKSSATSIARADIYPLNGGEPRLAVGSPKAIDALVRAYNLSLGLSVDTAPTPSEA